MRSPPPLLRRTLRLARTRGRSLGWALLALGEAVGQCWTLLLFAAVAPIALAGTGQGRQALLVSGGVVGFGGVALGTLGAALVLVYASVLLDRAPTRAHLRRARRYAVDVAPRLLAVATCYALPLAVRHGTGLDRALTVTPLGATGPRASLGFQLFALELVAPAVALFALPLAAARGPRAALGDRELLSLAGVGVVMFALLVGTDPGAVLLRFAVLLTLVVLVPWFATAGHRGPSAATRAERLATSTGIGAIYAAVVLWLAARLAADPAGRAPEWGPLTVVLLAALAWLCAAFLVDWALWLLGRNGRARRFPHAFAAARLVIFGAVAVRLLTGAFGDAAPPATPVPPGVAGQSVRDYVARWLAARGAQASVERPYPVFIVTAEGGGIRAAYWTATLLAALEDRHPGFADHVLALSGVSGGSVGASIFAAATTPAPGGAAPCPRTRTLEACAQAVAGGDMLSGPLASLLLAEPGYRLVGGQADRAAALDAALERAWHDGAGTDRFRAPFREFAAGRSLLLPNVTAADDGGRVVVTTLAGRGGVFRDARALDGRGFTLSTATLLSARFPLISPAAVVAAPGTGRALRLVDGGYADNSGAATGADVLGAFESLVAPPDRGRFRPVVLAVTNGEPPPAAAPALVPSAGAAPRPEPLAATRFLGALADPVLTLDGARGSVSRRFDGDLHLRVRLAGGEYLRLALAHGDADLPLGWMLAPATAAVIDARRRALAEDPNGGFARVGALLAGALLAGAPAGAPPPNAPPDSARAASARPPAPRRPAAAAAGTPPGSRPRTTPG